MPKETKKFINPLLRPSQQEVEPKQEPPPQQEKSAPLARVQASRTADQEVEQEERVKPAPAAPPVVPANNIPVLTTTERVRPPDSQPVRQPEAERVRPAEPARQPDPQPVSKEPVRAKVSRTGIYTADTYTADTQATNGYEIGVGDEASVQTYEPRPETIRARPNLTGPRPEAYVAHSSATTMTGAVAEPQARTEVVEFIEAGKDEEGGDEFYEWEEEPYTDGKVGTRKIRRRRGEQAFEKTHVRFTVWVDKALRQSFEDLAIQREQPKTVLLNEAIADLVRKYEVR